MMKTFKCIDYQQGKILVDENNQYSKLGDLVVSLNGDTYKSTVGERALQKNEYVVIAQHNLNLEGIPFIELEEDAEEMFTIELNKETKQVYDETLLEATKHGFLKGYKAAQPKKYTEEDVENAFLSGYWLHLNEDNNDLATRKRKAKQFIQSLQPKIKSVEVEWLHKDEPHLNGKSTITDRPITYQKDGKTYLKVNKINYELI